MNVQNNAQLNEKGNMFFTWSAILIIVAFFIGVALTGKYAWIVIGIALHRLIPAVVIVNWREELLIDKGRKQKFLFNQLIKTVAALLIIGLVWVLFDNGGVRF